MRNGDCSVLGSLCMVVAVETANWEKGGCWMGFPADECSTLVVCCQRSRPPKPQAAMPRVELTPPPQLAYSESASSPPPRPASRLAAPTGAGVRQKGG